VGRGRRKPTDWTFFLKKKSISVFVLRRMSLLREFFAMLATIVAFVNGPRKNLEANCLFSCKI